MSGSQGAIVSNTVLLLSVVNLLFFVSVVILSGLTRCTLDGPRLPPKQPLDFQTHQWAALTCPLGYATALKEQRSLHHPGNKINKK